MHILDATDPDSGKWMDVRNVSKDQFDVYVGKTPEIPFTVSDATYNRSMKYGW